MMLVKAVLKVSGSCCIILGIVMYLEELNFKGQLKQGFWMFRDVRVEFEFWFNSVKGLEYVRDGF